MTMSQTSMILNGDAMRSAIRKNALREIGSTFGRFFAILAIITLGVGFFTGVRITTPAMTDTIGRFLEESKFYDYRLLSTVGWKEEDIEDFSKRDGVRCAEGAYSIDFIASGLNEFVFRAHSITEDINIIKLTEGRMPENENECIAEHGRFEVGSVIYLSDENSDSIKNRLKSNTFTVVGLAQSPLYINIERGNSSVGNGEIKAFVYLPKEAFNIEVYTEAYIKFDEDYELYSDEYENLIDGKESEWEDIAFERAKLSSDEIRRKAEEKFEDGKKEFEEKRDEGKQKLDEAKQALDDGKAQLDEQLAQLEQIKDVMPEQYASGMEQYNSAYAEYESKLEEYQNSLAEYETQVKDGEEQLESGKKELEKIKNPSAYVLGRNTNIGYACFESDSDIIAQVAKVFPVFFILVAALVCMTTMTRMVEEQRTQTGVLKALGYSEGAVMGKFMFYSGTAAVIGCAIGYAAGTYLFPKIIWKTYTLMYLDLPMRYLFDTPLAVIALTVSLLCSIGVTWLSCRVELAETAAELMRPKAPKAGKRILLEYIGFIWNHTSFLHKVSARNIFRYKKRLFMMILGIGGCTALLLTGFGIKDSVAGFADSQYGEIQIADASAALREMEDGLPEDLENVLNENTSDHTLLYNGSWDLVYGKTVKSVTVNAADDYEDMDKYFVLRDMHGAKLAAPKNGEVLVSHSVSERYGIKTGSTLKLRDDEMQEIELKVTGVFENHVYNMVFINTESMRSQLNEEIQPNFAFINFKDGADISSSAAAVSGNAHVMQVIIFGNLRTRLNSMMSSLDYIVLIIIICAAGLAFIVLYNLTNINITERVREIATIKVLGFFRRETSAYVLRENLALTAMGTAAGIGAGILLHRFVMAQIKVDLVDFGVKILPESYAYSIALTFIFNFIVNLFMEIKLERINMAESLKSIE